MSYPFVICFTSMARDHADSTDEDRDDLADYVAERDQREPGFAALVDAASARRQLLDQLAAERTRRGLSQTAVAARMGTSQSTVARLEGGDVNATMSTVERFAIALGLEIAWELRPREEMAEPGPRSASSKRSAPVG